MSKKVNGPKIIDLDRPPRAVTTQPPTAPRRQPRRQCEFCCTNRSSILQWESRDNEERALQALRLAHPQEYEQLLQHEREAAQAVTEQAWQLHLEKKCAHAWKIAGTATHHRRDR